ncbi:uncharacterized protein LOC124262451 [Haliotis rubra]|uniref:uncharacterized protein LOC124262451 n=1 Tax=Haliotis rubra TaxID=36100 RepID=UPI001EE58BBA|nr:uncharacterized protein LOC124262451 [Haliotis rubra]
MLRFAVNMRPYVTSLLLVMEIYSTSRITHVKGQTLSLQGSSSTAVRGDTFQFTCTVAGGGGSLQGALYFLRARVFSSCTVNAGTCSQFTNEPGYTCECVGGQTRIFYMNVTSVSTGDGDTWRCQYSSSNSNSISLDVLCRYFRVGNNTQVSVVTTRMFTKQDLCN